MFFNGLYATSLSLGNMQEELDLFIDEEKWDQTDVITETGRVIYQIGTLKYFATILLNKSRNLKMWKGKSTTLLLNHIITVEMQRQ